MIKDFKKVIRECEYSNTYKMAWAKAIIELSNKYFDNANEYVELHGEDLKLFQRLVTLLDDVDDVQQVYHNVSNINDAAE